MHDLGPIQVSWRDAFLKERNVAGEVGKVRPSITPRLSRPFPMVHVPGDDTERTERDRRFNWLRSWHSFVLTDHVLVDRGFLERLNSSVTGGSYDS